MASNGDQKVRQPDRTHFTYSFEDGFAFHISEDSAKSHATKVLKDERQHAIEEGRWNDTIGSLCWGEVREYAHERVTWTRGEDGEDGEHVEHVEFVMGPPLDDDDGGIPSDLEASGYAPGHPHRVSLEDWIYGVQPKPCDLVVTDSAGVELMRFTGVVPKGVHVGDPYPEDAREKTIESLLADIQSAYDAKVTTHAKNDIEAVGGWILAAPDPVQAVIRAHMWARVAWHRSQVGSAADLYWGTMFRTLERLTLSSKSET
jgi:hypothetical protein